MSLTIPSIQPSISSVIIDSQKQNENQVVYTSTVNKSGTHLLYKILNLLDIKHDIDPRHKVGNKFSWKHLSRARVLLTEKNMPFRKIFNPNKKYLALYRDPRDLIISQIFFRKKLHRLGNAHIPGINRAPMQRLIQGYLNQDCEFGGAAKGQLDGVRMAIKLKQANFDNVLLLRFEDLIPTHAGGSSESERFRVFKQICDFTNSTASDEKIRNVMKECWGDTKGTFRESEPKKVGQWEKHFTEKNIKTFKQKYNHLLLKLGYETDPNWHLKYLSSTNTQ